ncbi:MAG TPA: cache domain-containing protein [Anaerolineales bacterium]|nr:cache domain-containing protein [Anaerolineales bacterium]
MRNSLRIRLTVILIGLAIGPLLISGVLLVQRSFSTVEAQALDLQSQVARNVASEMEDLLHDIENDLSNLGNDIRAFQVPDHAQQLSILLGALGSGTYKDAYEGFSLLDGVGQEQVRVSRQEIVPSGNLQSRVGLPEYEQPQATREVYFSPVWFDAVTGRPFITMAVPLFQPRSVELYAVLVADVRFEVVGNLLRRLQVGEAQTVYIVDPSGQVLARQDRTVDLQEARLVLPGQPSAQTGLDGTEVMLAYNQIQLGDQTLIAVAEKPAPVALELATSNMITIIIVIAGALVVAVIAVIVSIRQIVVPVEELARTAEQIAAGDLNQTAKVARKDEIGTLANTFNTMTEQLRNLIGTLEHRVNQRTQALATSTEVSRRLSTILNQDELVKEVVEQVQQAFNYYHTHIYLWDGKRENLVMAGGTGEAGRVMLASRHSIPAERGLVGRAAETGMVVLVPNVSQTIGWLPNPLLPETKSEVAVPILLGETVLGVLDVQHHIENGLTQADADLLQSIANQVAIALQNAQAFVIAQKEAEKEIQRNEIIQKIQNTTSIAEALKVAVRELGRATLVPQAIVRLYQETGENGQKTVTSTAD